ncbi:glycosyltransferase involved in cell wall biosynthesis [Methanolinea mesophila]|uniref:glycosyltransferase family 2 protein n=1 Tax=Methanolinea mesophila TaxID=547055 RepID=UPI001AE11B0E|nr:glycosyltransferase family 2 protein [Methanolinea mesophila]MBP1928313.1 glycosyltransferase involved in cell wall biosynthesis [Methanolinea mesophila]
MTPYLSIIIPVFNEQENITPLYDKLKKDLALIDTSYEVLFIDDGSNDSTFKKILDIQQKDNCIKIIKFRRNFGKSAALNIAFRKLQGNIVITMDGDLQDDSAEIGNFLRKIDEGYDLVSGWKFQRNDPFTKVFPSRIFNGLTSWITGVKLHDFNCGFKAYRREVTDAIYLYGEMHRYIPILAAQYGFKIAEIQVHHKPRRFGRSKYGFSRLFKGFLDLITVKYITSYSARPLHAFGVPGFVFLGLGFIIGIYLLALKYLENIVLSERPLLLLSVLLIVLGLQFISIGLLGEMITHRETGKENLTPYIEKSIGI